DPSPLRDTELVQEIQFLTARLAAKGNNYANKLLEELDLNVRQFSVLALAASALKPTQREMSSYVALDPSQIVALVDTLESRGLVKRETDRRDRRSKNIVATAEGEKLYKQARGITMMAEDHVLTDLTLAERDQLRELLSKATLHSPTRRVGTSYTGPHYYAQVAWALNMAGTLVPIKLTQLRLTHFAGCCTRHIINKND